MPEENPNSKSDVTEEQPPVFRSWKHWYALVLITLVVLIIVFYWFTLAFS